MPNICMCADHVNRMRSTLTGHGAGQILPPGDHQPEYDPSDGRIPDILTIAISHMMLRSFQRPMTHAQSDAVCHGGCIVCHLHLEGWYDVSANAAIEIYMTHTPIGGSA